MPLMCWNVYIYKCFNHKMRDLIDKSNNNISIEPYEIVKLNKFVNRYVINNKFIIDAMIKHYFSDNVIFMETSKKNDDIMSIFLKIFESFDLNEYILNKIDNNDDTIKTYYYQMAEKYNYYMLLILHYDNHKVIRKFAIRCLKNYELPLNLNLLNVMIERKIFTNTFDEDLDTLLVLKLMETSQCEIKNLLLDKYTYYKMSEYDISLFINYFVDCYKTCIIDDVSYEIYDKLVIPNIHMLNNCSLISLFMSCIINPQIHKKILDNINLSEIIDDGLVKISIKLFFEFYNSIMIENIEDGIEIYCDELKDDYNYIVINKIREEYYNINPHKYKTVKQKYGIVSMKIKINDLHNLNNELCSKFLYYIDDINKDNKKNICDAMMNDRISNNLGKIYNFAGVRADIKIRGNLIISHMLLDAVPQHSKYIKLKYFSGSSNTKTEIKQKYIKLIEHINRHVDKIMLFIKSFDEECYNLDWIQKIAYFTENV
jgi:hypothetical protein